MLYRYQHQKLITATMLFKYIKNSLFFFTAFKIRHTQPALCVASRRRRSAILYYSWADLARGVFYMSDDRVSICTERAPISIASVGLHCFCSGVAYVTVLFLGILVFVWDRLLI